MEHEIKQNLNDLFINYENEVLIASGDINADQKEAATRIALLKVIEHKLQLLER